VLSTRVAFLTICIVVVLPIFGMFTYPERDDSMKTWVEVLASCAKELHDEWQNAPRNSTEIWLSRRRLDRELNAFADFYNDLSYGPFMACFGYNSDDEGLACRDQLYSQSQVNVRFNTSFEQPGRPNFIRIVTQNSFMAAFDMSTPKKYESVSSGGLIIFIIVLMCVFGLVTSNSVTVIALHPLERMLTVVRERCKQIFKYTNDLQEDDSEDEEEGYDDADHTSEFALLERVIGKLAAIAHVSNTKDEPEVKEGMTDDEVMTLNWMQGTQVCISSRRRPSKMPPGAEEVSGGGDAVHSAAANKGVLDDLPCDILDALETSSFNTLDLLKASKQLVAVHIILTTEGCSQWIRQNVQEDQLFKYVTAAESRYQDNPFHNFAHALDVEYTCARHMRLTGADEFLPDSSQFWLLIAAISHVLGHLGVNNQYLIETSHELALKYNDRSPLENMHCATLFQVASDPEINVFAQDEKELYKEMRKGIINAILHTDVIKHNEMMKELTMLYTMDSEAFDASRDHGLFDAAVQVLQDHTQLTLNALLHCADVGNPMKPWDLAQRLAYLCVDEFFAQGDLEKAAGIPVQMLNDRDKVNRPNSQIGFIEFVIAPMVEAIVHLFPTLDDLADNLGTNITRWFDVWDQEVSPGAEVKTKTEARVMKVAGKCKAVMRPDDTQHASEGGGGMRLSFR